MSDLAEDRINVAGPATELPRLTPVNPEIAIVPVSPSGAYHCISCSNPQWGPDFDAEDRIDYPPPGWPEVTRLMIVNPDLQAFSAFTDLNVKSLLYYQAQLDDLRVRLHRIEWKDYRRSNFQNAQDYGRRVDLLLSGDSKDENERQQWELIIYMRRLLKE